MLLFRNVSHILGSLVYGILHDVFLVTKELSQSHEVSIRDFSKGKVDGW